MAVKAIAEDMTREGITLGSDMAPELVDKMYAAFNKKYYDMGQIIGGNKLGPVIWRGWRSDPD
jgi:hypothetical protein